jgi:hypothetical protein
VPDSRTPAGTGAAGQREGGAAEKAIEESVDLAYKIFNPVFRRIAGRMQDKF